VSDLFDLLSRNIWPALPHRGDNFRALFRLDVQLLTDGVEKHRGYGCESRALRFKVCDPLFQQGDAV